MEKEAFEIKKHLEGTIFLTSIGKLNANNHSLGFEISVVSPIFSHSFSKNYSQSIYETYKVVNGESHGKLWKLVNFYPILIETENPYLDN